MDIKEFLQKKIDEVESPLYHAISVENFLKALKENKLEGRTTQRYWLDGIRRKDKDPDYENSKWMKGWSMTRDFDFAARFNDVVIVFDKKDIEKQFEITPYSWNFSISGVRNHDHKKEREEFVISIKTNKSTNDYKKITDRENALNRRRYRKTKDRKYLDNIVDCFEKIKSPEGKCIDSLNVKIKGIYLSEYFKNDNSILINEIIKMKQFKGFFDETKIKNRYNNTIDSVSNISFIKRRNN